jgi:hypothetical protein
MTRIYGVREYDDMVFVRDGQLAKNGNSYYFESSHPGYGYHIRVALTEAAVSREAAVAVWRSRLVRERDELLGRVARINARLAVGVKDETP